MHDCYLFWSIYVKTSNKRKLLEAHVPPISEAIEQLEFEWQIIVEEENPGLFRLITYQNLTGLTKEQLIVISLRRAGRLASNWNIAGLQGLSRDAPPYLHGGCDKPNPTNRPPSIESMMFEIEAGQIAGMSPDGVWKVVSH